MKHLSTFEKESREKTKVVANEKGKESKSMKIKERCSEESRTAY